MKDAEGVIQQRNTAKARNTGVTADATTPVKAVPQEWLSSFGTDYYSPATIQADSMSPDEWNAQVTGKPIPRNDPFNATSEADLKQNIDSIIATITEGSAGHD